MKVKLDGINPDARAAEPRKRSNSLLFGMRSIAGTMTGSLIETEDTLFLSRQQIRPMIETVPLANAAEAYGRVMRNEARFRIVLVTGQ